MGIENELFARPWNFVESPTVNERTPNQVISQSKNALDLYFSDTFSDALPAREYLREYTVPLIGSAIEAIDMMGPLIRDLGENDSRKIREYIGNDGASLEMQPNLEAFDVFQLVFSRMPDYYVSPFFKSGFSKICNLRRPSNVSDYLVRVTELDRVVKGIINRNWGSDEIFESEMPLLRTHAFFEIGANLPATSAKWKSLSQSIHGEWNV